MNKVKRIIAWILTVFFALSAIVFFPSIFSIFAFLAVILIIPITKWQEIIQKFISSKVKSIIAAVLVIISIFSVPSNKSTTNLETDSNCTATTIPIPSSSVALDNTTDLVSSVPTIEPSTTTNTIPSAPSTEPMTAPTVPPTTPTTTPNLPSAESSHTHSFSTATCTAPKTCSCGATEGTATGHSWKNATCSEPKTCIICNTTNGSALGHAFSNGNCSSCGKADPNYTTTTYVLNVESMKFHLLSCRKLPSNNRKDTTMSREEIVNAGYEPCGICHP